ncbi:G-protein coupled receptor [Branchiostoma belcheri]|nr:G-protein coupled receptor [Branchiostoma belcheri]
MDFRRPFPPVRRYDGPYTDWFPELPFAPWPRFPPRYTDDFHHHHLRVLNGRVLGDLKGRYTCYQPNGCSTVDYAIAGKLDDIIKNLYNQSEASVKTRNDRAAWCHSRAAGCHSELTRGPDRSCTLDLPTNLSTKSSPTYTKFYGLENDSSPRGTV